MKMHQRRLAQVMARLPKTQPAGYTEAHGVVVSASSGIATVRVSGDTTNLPGMHVAQGLTVTAGQTVIVRIKGSDAYVAGRLQ